MTTENEFTFDLNDEAKTEREQFLRFIHENDLRSEALAIFAETRRSSKQSVIVAESGASLSQNLGSNTPSVRQMSNISSPNKERVSKFEATRKKLKMNQKAFATALGISQGMVSLIESGKAQANPEVMEKVIYLGQN